MTNKTYNTNKQIPPERWEEFCDSFTLANQDRLISIEVVGFDIGDQQLANMVPFSAIDCDTPQTVQVDGEVWDPTPLSASVLPGVLPILTPPAEKKS